MATFNVSFLNPALQKSGGSGPSVSILSDQLQILENELAKDGYLSPGDYELLINKAREIQNNPSLTESQRSNYNVKISNYEKQKSVLEVEKSSDIETLNKQLQSEAAEDVMIVGNNPVEFLKGRQASLEAKLNTLSEAMQQKVLSGADTVDYQNEINETLREYQKTLETFEMLGNYDGGDPVNGLVAYVETNNNGEIVNVHYGQHGDKTGYVETNGVIDGFQVYGKVNYKRDDSNYFILGNKEFSASNMLIPDPNNPGAFKTNKLMADVENVGGRGVIRRAESGFVNFSGQNLSVQDYVPKNSWAKGVNGSLYKRTENGDYQKYLNANPEDLDVNGPIINLPESYERTLMQNVSETIDFSQPMTPDQGQMGVSSGLDGLGGQDVGGINTQQSQRLDSPYPNVQGPYPMQQQQQSSSTQIRRTAQSPTERASTSVMDTARRTVQSGANYLKSLFS